MEYQEIKDRFCNGNMIRSLKDGVVRKYSGFLTLVGVGEDERGYDSYNEELVVFKGGKLAEVVDQGINEYEEHQKFISKVQQKCKDLGCTRQELLMKDYTKILMGEKKEESWDDRQKRGMVFREMDAMFRRMGHVPQEAHFPQPEPMFPVHQLREAYDYFTEKARGLHNTENFFYWLERQEKGIPFDQQKHQP